MSHFTVGVIIKHDTKEENLRTELEKLLAPYQENNMGDCPNEYIEFIRIDKDELEECRATYESNADNEYDKYKTFAEYMQEECGYEFNNDADTFGYYENPNARWDWYKVGGRWSNMLLLKDGTKSDVSYIKDIDFEEMSANSRKSAADRWDSIKEPVLRFFNGIEKTDTRESYIKRNSEFSTYAVITPNGKWHEKGQMGYWGISSETIDECKKWNKSYYDTFIKNTDPNDILIIVDCHI